MTNEKQMTYDGEDVIGIINEACMDNHHFVDPDVGDVVDVDLVMEQLSQRADWADLKQAVMDNWIINTILGQVRLRIEELGFCARER